LVDRNAQRPAGCNITSVLTALEANLDQLDGLGLTIAAAHLDTAIHQLRRDKMAARESASQD
jgi:hypothetical protein